MRMPPEAAARVLAARSPHPALAPDPALAPETMLWAALQDVGGGSWAGCVFDVDAIIRTLDAGKKALQG